MQISLAHIKYVRIISLECEHIKHRQFLKYIKYNKPSGLIEHQNYLHEDAKKQPSSQNALNQHFHDENVSSPYLAFFSFSLVIPGAQMISCYSYIIHVADLPMVTSPSPRMQLVEGLPRQTSKTTFLLTPIVTCVRQKTL